MLLFQEHLWDKITIDRRVWIQDQSAHSVHSYVDRHCSQNVIELRLASYGSFIDAGIACYLPAQRIFEIIVTLTCNTRKGTFAQFALADPRWNFTTNIRFCAKTDLLNRENHVQTESVVSY